MGGEGVKRGEKGTEGGHVRRADPLVRPYSRDGGVLL